MLAIVVSTNFRLHCALFFKHFISRYADFDYAHLQWIESWAMGSSEGVDADCLAGASECESNFQLPASSSPTDTT